MEELEDYLTCSKDLFDAFACSCFYELARDYLDRGLLIKLDLEADLTA